MSRKHSDRRGGGVGAGAREPDVTPMMNLTFMLILALLTLSAIVPVGLISVQAPQLFGGAEGEGEQEPRLRLTIFVTKDGYNLSTSGTTFDGSTDTPPRPGEPLLPKARHGGRTTYNYQALRERLIEIKKRFPREQSVIIAADEDVVYGDIVKTLDAARSSADGTELFPAAAFSAGIIG